MDFDWSEQNAVVHPEWEGGPDAPAPATKAARISWRTSAGLALLVTLLGTLIIVGRDATEDLAAPPTTSPETAPSSTTTDVPARPGTRVIGQLDGPVLGVELDAIAVSTDFDGRIVALDLDSGTQTRMSTRTGTFVTIDGQLVMQTGCGGWQIIDVPNFTAEADLIGCGSYQPVGQVGSEAAFFMRPDSGGSDELLVYDDGGLLAVVLEGSISNSLVTVSDGKILAERPDHELVWIDPATGESEFYAEGSVLAAAPGGVLWSNSCERAQPCEVWFGTPDDARVRQFVLDPFDAALPVRLNSDGSRAVFFKDDDILRIVTIETGHARELKNPGISATKAAWSPDGLWLLEPTGATVVALNTLNGRSLEFAGVPGDVSPGWIAVVDAR